MTGSFADYWMLSEYIPLAYIRVLFDVHVRVDNFYSGKFHRIFHETAPCSFPAVSAFIVFRCLCVLLVRHFPCGYCHFHSIWFTLFYFIWWLQSNVCTKSPHEFIYLRLWIVVRMRECNRRWARTNEGLDPSLPRKRLPNPTNKHQFIANCGFWIK